MHGDMRGVRPHHVIALVWAANFAGAMILLVEYLVVLPFPPEASTSGVVRSNVILGVVCILVSWVVLAVVGEPRTHRALDWTVRGTDPDPEEQRLTLGLPWSLFGMQVVLWALSCLAFLVRNLGVDVGFAFQVAGAVMAGGLATATLSFLLGTRLLRQATSRVLEIAPPRPGTAAGVGERAVFIWALTTGVPMLGLILMVAFSPESDVSLEKLALSGLVVGLVSLVAGLAATVLFAKSVGEPLCELTTALAEVERGDLTVSVAVDDTGEIGQLQAGLNNMVSALNEREQLRDLFGRHVGVDVARLALRQGVALGGEEREVAALFVDIIGSTSLAARRTPGEVVAALNRFFEVVVDVVSSYGGLVNKFEGDAALCIFGAPLELDDPAAAALGAARTMAQRLRAEVPDLDAGIGVSHGLVIAGNIGSTERLEYTVIGDPVNEAARLTEQAKDHPGRVLASKRIVDRASADEGSRWRLLEPLLLRGRLDPTTLAVPV
jgi:adenylate cyclase